MSYYGKTVRYNGGIIRQVTKGWQGEINKIPYRLRSTYPALQDAKNWIDEKQVIITNEGIRALELTQMQRIEAAKALATLKNVSLTEAVAFYMRHHHPPGNPKTLQELLDSYIKAKQTANLRPKSMQGIRLLCGRLTRDLGGNMVHDIIAEDLAKWLDCHHLHAVSRLNYITAFHGMFNYAIRQGLIEKNPAAGLDRPRLDETLPAIFPVDQVKTLLTTADQNRKYRPILPWLAIGFFAGLRSSELAELKWQHVDLNRGIITVPPTIAKKRRQRYTTVSENLRSWLASCAGRKGKTAPPDSTRRRILAKLLKQTKIQWVHNGMRHSFGSYHLARWNDPQRTSMEMGHGGTNTAILFNHYRALVHPDVARDYWSILPSSPK